jgi:heme/copper-type cytochrome/quinol oxidase subunit 1
MFEIRRWMLPPFIFFASALMLVPVGLLTFHSMWPPLWWKHTHVADCNFGQQILQIAMLFGVFALIYLLFPRILRRRMSVTLGWLHYGLNVVALALQYAIPAYLNLRLDWLTKEPKFWQVWEGFRSGVQSAFLEFSVLVFAQVPLLINLIWSIFRGEKLSKKAPNESFLVARPL